MDLKALSTDELHGRAIAARQVHGASEATLMFLLAELEERQVYLDYGCSSISQPQLWGGRMVEVGQAA
ncbi:MAG: hypothetical protein ACYCW6_25340 [Candidatus Xenobia bacterium]